MIQRRALSPVSEDSEPSEGREQKNNNIYIADTISQILPFEEPMDFETIDEREFPILTEDLSTTFSQEGITQLVEEVVPNNRSQDVNSPVVYTSASNEQTTFAKDAEVIVGQKTGAKKIVTINPSMNMEPTTEFSTPDRPSGPLLEEIYPKPSSKQNLRSSITKQALATTVTSATRQITVKQNQQKLKSTPDRPSGPLHNVNSSKYFKTRLPSKVQPINQTRTSYSEIVKTPASRVINKPSTKSTSDISKQVSTNIPHTESMSKSTFGPHQHQTKVPFKLVPVQPPQRKSDVDLITAPVTRS